MAVKNIKELKSLKKLSDNIGSEVTVFYIWENYLDFETGKLESVNDGYIQIGKFLISFFEPGTAIYKIIDKDGKVIYFNHYVQKHGAPACHLTSNELNEKFFGKGFCEERCRKERVEVLDTLACFHAYNGLDYIKPEFSEEWVNWTRSYLINTANEYMLMLIVSAMINLSYNFDETVNSFTEDYPDLVLVSAITHFYVEGERFRKALININKGISYKMN